MRYRIAETRTFQEELDKPRYRNIYRRIREYVYPILRQNPFFGPSIKRLKGKYSGYFRYRIGQYRVFYKISPEQITVYMVGIAHRRDAYR